MQKVQESVSRGNLPSGVKIREFIIESQKCQTLYANCEGSCNRTVMNINDKYRIDNFINFMMYSNNLQGGYEEQDFVKREHVKEIRDRIIFSSIKFNLDGKVHFAVIWVYYYVYQSNTQKGTPVFKIYKKKSGDEAVFLDASLNLYESWDSYLNYAEFPKSFLCVPRNGNYSFSNCDKMLDLQFLSSKDVTKKNELQEFDAFAGFMPFSQVTFYPWLNKIKDLKEMVNQFVYDLLRDASDKVKKSLNEVVTCVNIIYKSLKNFMITQKNLKCPLEFILMLLISALTEPKKLFTFEFYKGIIQNFASNSFLSADDVNSLLGVYDDIIKLVDCLKKPNPKDSLQILKLFCRLFRKISPLLKYIPVLQPFLQEPQYLFQFLNICSALLDTEEETTNKLIQHSISSNIRVGNPVRNLGSESKENHTENFQI